jgi:DNA-binding CsgD family transcriptional regulator
MEVLTWTAEGYSSEAVAKRLGLSTSAVNYHITNCCRKLGASNKTQAVALAIRMNLM